MTSENIIKAIRNEWSDDRDGVQEMVAEDLGVDVCELGYEEFVRERAYAYCGNEPRKKGIVEALLAK